MIRCRRFLPFFQKILQQGPFQAEFCTASIQESAIYECFTQTVFPDLSDPAMNHITFEIYKWFHLILSNEQHSDNLTQQHAPPLEQKNSFSI